MMSTPFFPTGLSINFNDINMEKMEFYAKAWNLERMQMQKGLYVGSLTAVHTPKMQLMSTPHSHGILLQGDFPKGTILIAAVMTKADVAFQNKIVNDYEIKILTSGDEIDFLCNGDSETFTIAVEEKLFYESYHAYFGNDFLTSSKEKNIYIDPQYFSFFMNGIQKWISYLKQDHKLLDIELEYENIESNILTHLFSCIYLDSTSKYRQKFKVQNIRDILHQSIQEPVNMDGLSNEMNVSKRLIYHAFKSNYGYTPKRYLLSLRMHRVRQELLLADPMNDSVTGIIQKYNFFNLTAFSTAYKTMFAELPSKTLHTTLLH